MHTNLEVKPVDAGYLNRSCNYVCVSDKDNNRF